jgi:rhodanese-related sulfurtransferase
MISLLKNLFSKGPQVNLTELINNNALILDVRTSSEYKGGHIKGSVNIPVQNLSAELSKLKKDRVIITCCASGSRSAFAMNILKSNGFNEVHNGGSWLNLKQLV